MLNETFLLFDDTYYEDLALNFPHFKLKFANVKIVHLFVKQTLLRKLRFSRGRGGPKGKITSEMAYLWQVIIE